MTRQTNTLPTNKFNIKNTCINWHSKQKLGPCAIILGQFDGVHLGHQELIKTAISMAKQQGILATAMLFNPLPKAIFANDFLPIQTHSQRLDLMQKYGLDGAYEVTVKPEFLALSAIEFIEILQCLNVTTVVVGADFRFGHKRVGDIELLSKHFQLEIVPEVIIDGRRISSSWCRELITQNNFQKCAELLGRKWQFTAKFDNSIAERPGILLPNTNKSKAIISHKNINYQSHISIDSFVEIHGLAIDGYADIIIV